MLVASAAIGLIAPIGAQANDINIEGMNSYTSSKSSSKKQQFNSKTFANELATVNEKIDVLETQFNDFEAGGFSDTTTMDGKAVFTVGALDADDSITALNENAVFQYMYVMNLNSSFSGDSSANQKTAYNSNAKPSPFRVPNRRATIFLWNRDQIYVVAQS